jgi:hypothetical protein
MRSGEGRNFSTHACMHPHNRDQIVCQLLFLEDAIAASTTFWML